MVVFFFASKFLKKQEQFYQRTDFSTPPTLCEYKNHFRFVTADSFLIKNILLKNKKDTLLELGK